MQSLKIRLLKNIYGMERNVYDKQRKKQISKQCVSMIQSVGRGIRKELELIVRM